MSGRDRKVRGSTQEKLRQVSNASIGTKRRRHVNRRVKRVEEDREPKVNENTKSALFFKGQKTSEAVSRFIDDLYHFKKPDAMKFNRRKDWRPFEEIQPLEFIASKKDASLFVFGSNSKKRPDNIILGRLFDNALLDMIEVGIGNYIPLDQFPGEKQGFGNKPCFLFQGVEFEQNEEFKNLANLLIDFFRGSVIEKVDMQGLDHVIVCTSVPTKVYFRVYRIKLKKSGAKKPRVELSEMGPSFDMVVRRTRFASQDLMRAALKVPIDLLPHKKKNITRDEFGTKATVHIQQQDLATLNQKKQKGLKKGKRKATEGGQEQGNGQEGSQVGEFAGNPQNTRKKAKKA